MKPDRKEMIDRIEFLRNRLHEDDSIEALDYVLDVLLSHKPKLLFSQRVKVGELYTKWIETNNVLDAPESFVSFLEINDWLDTEKIKHDIQLKTEENNDSSR